MKAEYCTICRGNLKHKISSKLKDTGIYNDSFELKHSIGENTVLFNAKYILNESLLRTVFFTAGSIRCESVEDKSHLE